MKLLVMQFSTLFSNIIAPCSVTNVRDQATYRQTHSKIVVLDVLILRLQIAEEKTTGSALNGRYHYENSISC
jgi:hypothetical protein